MITPSGLNFKLQSNSLLRETSQTLLQNFPDPLHREQMPNPIRGYWVGKDIHHGKPYSELTKACLTFISHNKTLAAQLYSEFKAFFPENAVEYFVSYYDYYQPEAYALHRYFY